MNSSRQHLLELFESWASDDRPLFAYDDGYRTIALSTGQTARAAWAFAVTLEKAGIAPGERVILWGENRPGWVIALWGCLLRGAVAVPMDARSSRALVERVRDITAASGVVVGDEVDWAGPAWRMSDLETGRAAPGVSAARDESALAEILFTSGATAEPKGVRITHRNLLANLNPVEQEIRRYRAEPIVRWFAEPLLFPIRFLNLLPLSHLFGQTMAAFIPPMLDGQVIFLKGHHPPEIVRQVRRRRISVIVAVPKMLEMLRDYVISRCPETKEPGPPRGLLASFWRYRRVHRLLGWKCWAFIVGAAPLDPELEAFWRRLGYAVIQGYGLTETAPIVSLNHPFHSSHGTVGKPIPGVEMKLAEDGEILVRGANITTGYYGSDTKILDDDGWFGTGDVGELAEDGALRIRGRKKEMIVAADGTNIFPDDLERAIDAVPGVVESAVVEREGRAHAVLVLKPGTRREAVLTAANARLEPHQQIRDATLWPPGSPLPRTSGTGKLKRRHVQDWLRGVVAAVPETGPDLGGVLARYGIGEGTKLNELGLSSLERIQLLMELEERTGQPVDESLFTRAQTLAEVAILPAVHDEPLDFPVWNRQWWARAIRRVSLPVWVLPLARMFLWVRVRGLEHLEAVDGPVLFAVNHQSYFDTAALLIALPGPWRYRLAVAMRKEFFDAHYHPEQYGLAKRLRNRFGYYLACLMLSAFPLPQRETGTKDALRYMGELLAGGWSVMIFPEGRHADGDDVAEFQPGIGMMGSRLGVPVIPVRLRGVHRVLHRDSRLPRPGVVEVAFGAPMILRGAKYDELARDVEREVKNL